jgi:hypothetical protein
MMRYSFAQCLKLLPAGMLSLVFVVSSCAIVTDVTPSPTTATGAPTRECTFTVSEDDLARLTLSLQPSIGMRPGEKRKMTVGVIECCTFLKPIDACVTWSVEPDDGAIIGPDGELSIDSSTPGGTVLRVTADVEDGRRQISIDVHVYDPAQNPLIGTWREEAQIVCEGEDEVIPHEPIEELRFFADGRVNVTWTPFETYVDYWGTYTFSDDGAIELVITDGNYIPDDFDGTGRFTISEEGSLLLKDMWLGSPQYGEDAANCGHRFGRSD